MKNPIRNRLLALCLGLVLSACAGDEEAAYVERTVERLYNNGVDALQVGNFTNAIAAFDEVERQHPYSVWATKAQLMSAYASYKKGEYDETCFSRVGDYRKDYCGCIMENLYYLLHKFLKKVNNLLIIQRKYKDI